MVWFILLYYQTSAIGGIRCSSGRRKNKPGVRSASHVPAALTATDELSTVPRQRRPGTAVTPPARSRAPMRSAISGIARELSPFVEIAGSPFDEEPVLAVAHDILGSAADACGPNGAFGREASIALTGVPSVPDGRTSASKRGV